MRLFGIVLKCCFGGCGLFALWWGINECDRYDGGSFVLVLLCYYYILWDSVLQLTVDTSSKSPSTDPPFSPATCAT